MFLRAYLRRGEKLRMWLNQLKVAVVQKDIKLLESLLSAVPTFESEEEVQNAFYLLKEASAVVESLKDETATSMTQVKKNIDFLKSTHSMGKGTLDISS